MLNFILCLFASYSTPCVYLYPISETAGRRVVRPSQNWDRAVHAAGRVARVRFSSRWYLRGRKSPYALHPVSQTFPQSCLWHVRLTDDRWPFRKVDHRGLPLAKSFSYRRPMFSCGLGLVSAGSVCSSSIHQIFREASYF